MAVIILSLWTSVRYKSPLFPPPIVLSSPKDLLLLARFLLKVKPKHKNYDEYYIKLNLQSVIPQTPLCTNLWTNSPQLSEEPSLKGVCGMFL